MNVEETAGARPVTEIGSTTYRRPTTFIAAETVHAGRAKSCRSPDALTAIGSHWVESGNLRFFRGYRFRSESGLSQIAWSGEGSVEIALVGVCCATANIGGIFRIEPDRLVVVRDRRALSRLP
jgi:hypothetical protein